jgi:hypothetical protein
MWRYQDSSAESNYYKGYTPFLLSSSMAPTPRPPLLLKFLLLDLFSRCSLAIRAHGRGGGWSQLSRRQLKLAPLPLYFPLGVRVLHSLDRLNMELDLQSLLVLHVHSWTHNYKL